MPKPPGHAWYRELAPLGLICVVGLFLRWYRLSSVPSGVLYDEAFNGLDVLRILDGARPLFLPANSGREALFIYLQALSVSWFGPTDWPLRVPSAVVGSMTIPLSYLLVTRLSNRRVALLTSAWLAISLWHVMFSRIGLRAIILPLFGAAAFYCLWRGLDAGWTTELRMSEPPLPARPTTGLAWFALAGVALGLSLYTYTSARFLPMVVLAFAGYLGLAHRRLFWRALPGFVLAGVLTMLIFLPEGLYFVQHPQDFVFRANVVSVFNPGLNHGDPAGAILYATSRSLAMFSFQGDGTWERNIPARPIFDPVSSVFLGLGLLLTGRSIRDPRSAFLLLWLATMVVPSALAVLDVPNFLRVTGMIPALFILPSLGVDWLWSLWDRRTWITPRAVPLFIVTAGFLAGTYQTYESYFGVWANDLGVIQTFSADHWLAIGAARALAPTTTAPMYVGAGDADEPAMAYNLRGPGGTTGLRVFNDHNSIILPPIGTAASYIFAQRDLPPASVLQRFFPDQTGQTLARAADGEAVTLFQLPVIRPDVQPKRTLLARFGSNLQITGFDVPTDVAAGQSLTVRWYWTTLASDPRELTFFNQVIGDNNEKLGAFDGRAFAPGYWPAGTRGISSFEVPIDPAATTGAYDLIAGVYFHDNLMRLPVFDTLGRRAGFQLNLGQIKVHGHPAPVPRPTNPRPASWSDGIKLLGSDLAPGQVSPGHKLTVTLYWSARSRPTTDYTVFIHLLDSNGRVVTQADSPPRNGEYPTTLWNVGDTIVDSHELSVDPNVPPGSYSLEIGLYQPGNGQRLTLVNRSGHSLGDRLLLSDITVK